MITRLKIDGFKNLVDVEIFFGPFTCIAGRNGVGKSNIFDAIAFLAASAGDRTLLAAAQSIRGEENREQDIAGLFHKEQGGTYDRMSFEVDMIISEKAIDHLGQEATAGRTFLNYKLVIAYSPAVDSKQSGLRIESEDLMYIPRMDAAKRLPFPHSPEWRDSIIKGDRRTPYISTAKGIVRLHQDGGTRGRAWQYPANTLPRTVLSSVTAQEGPTALAAREEMRSWGQLQLEPSRLRAPDSFQSPTSISSNGAYLASTLHHLAEQLPKNGLWEDADAVYCELANRLAELIGDVGEISVDRDEKREIYTLFAAGRDGVRHPARALSDGTLRFLALAVMQLDPGSARVLCLEEPENGIHPERIDSMQALLEAMATDCQYAVDETNPLRQVIINTHSPTVVAESPDDSIIFLTKRNKHANGRPYMTVDIASVDGTWRASDRVGTMVVSKGDIGRFLLPVRPSTHPPKRKRIKDRPDLQMSWLDGWENENSQ